MATQVVVFSVLLFGTSGVVLDFGRVYSEHSKMQAYTDQAALAAASELDGDVGAIQRAVDRVFGTNDFTPISKSAQYSEGDGDLFNISHLYFLSDMERDGGPQYDLSDALAGPNLLHVAFADGGSAGASTPEELEALSTQAEFVIAVAEERSVRNGLMQLINATGRSSVRETNIVRTIAAAQRRSVTCGSLSNLIICNPWENDPGQSFESVVNNPANVGFQALHIAGAQAALAGGGDAGDGDGPPLNTLLRRFELEGAAAVRAICDNNASLPGGAGASAADRDLAYTICMLAAAVQDDNFCVDGNEVAFAEATPEEITTALSTAFDLWDYPISEVLEWDKDDEGDHTQSVELDPVTGQPVIVDGAQVSIHEPAEASLLRHSSPLFQPDQNILKARIWDPELALANAALGIPNSSRLNYVPHPQADNYNLNLSPCFRTNTLASCMTTSEGDVIDYLGQPTTYTNVTEYYISNYANLFRRTFQPPSFDITSFYRAYQAEREEWLVAEQAYFTLTGVQVFAGQSQTWTGEDASLATDTGSPFFTPEIQRRAAFGFCDNDGDLNENEYCDVNGDGVFPTSSVDFNWGTDVDPGDTTPSYSNYTYQDPATGDINRDLERRVFDVTVINCGAAFVGDDGVPRAEVAGFAKMFLLQPPRPFCSDGTDQCTNDQLVRSEIYTEFVGGSSVTPEHYAVLVR